MEKVCILCGKSYKPTRWGQKYCGVECFGKSQRKEVQTKKCINCGKEFTLSRRNSQKINDGRLYCGQSCAYYGSERNKKISKVMKGRFTGEQSYHWKGGKRITKFGYISVLSPDHPNKNKTGCVLEHRLVVEEAMGRKLLKDEIVHHLNGITSDNRIENLQVMSHAEHNRLHKIGKSSWSLGKTKETDERIAKMAEAKMGKNHWTYRRNK